MENYKTVDVTAGAWKVRIELLKVYRQRACQCGRGWPFCSCVLEQYEGACAALLSILQAPLWPQEGVLRAAAPVWKFSLGVVLQK